MEINNNLYPYYRDIKYENFKQFNEDITAERNSIYSRNFDLLKETTAVVDINAIGSIPEGRFSAFIDEVEFECLFVRKKQNKLYVVFSGSRELTDKLPIFKRWTYSSFFDGSTLNIADPMYRQFDKLHLGWYYGTKDNNYLDKLIALISAVASHLEISNENIVFFSSSGGGYAALYCASKMEGTYCAVINPQINLSKYFYCKEFCEITHNDLFGSDEFGRNDIPSLMMNAKNTGFLLIENCRAIEDMTQVEDLCKRFDYTFKFGLQNITQNILLWVYDAEARPFHSAQDYPELFFTIRSILSNFSNAAENEELYAYFSELWHERFNLIEKINTAERNKKEAVVELFSNEYSKSSFSERNLIQTENAETGFYINVYDKFKGDSVYCLQLENICSPDNSSEEFTVYIKNGSKNEPAYIKHLKTSIGNASLYFKTSEKADGLELRIYSGNVYKNNANSKIAIGKIRLAEIECVQIKEELTVEKTSSHTYPESEYLYIRGYVITESKDGRPSAVNPNWKELVFGENEEYTVFYDGRNQTVKFNAANSKTWVMLLGSFMDTEQANDNISDIAEELVKRLDISMDSFWDYVDILNGRHIIVYGKDGEVNLFTDATGMRSTYYCTEKMLIASHYGLIGDIFPCSNHPFYDEYRAYFKENMGCYSLPGNITPLKEVKILIPNHYVSLLDGHTITRFYPRKPVENRSIEEVCDYIAASIKRQYEKLVEKHDVIHSMTAGCDSRISLAAAKNVKDKITLFTYHNENPNMSNHEHRDREINYLCAKNIAEHENIKHLEIILKGKRPDDMVSVMNKNHYHPHNKFIEDMRAGYDFTPNTIHLRSNNIELCRNRSHSQVFVDSDEPAHKFARWANYKGDILDKAISYFQDFVDENDIYVYKKFNFDWGNPYVIEVQAALWISASVLVDNDMLCDTYMLFNVRKILDMAQSLPTYWREQNVIYRELLKRLYPSLLDYNMPNNTIINYDMIDKEFSGCKNFKDAVFTSGNLSDKSREVPYYAQTRDFGSNYGFSQTRISKDDFIRVDFTYAIEKDLPYYFEFNIFTVWQSYSRFGELKYDVLIDDKPIYAAYCNEFNDRVNNIMYCFRARYTGKCRISIRLVAVKDVPDGNYNGIIDIKSVTLRREWMKKFSETPVVISSKDNYLKLQ